MEQIALIGGGGHCRSVIDSILRKKDFQIAAIVDIPSNLGNDVYGFTINATDDDLPALHKSGIRYAFVTIGGVGGNKLKLKLYEQAKSIGFQFPVICDPSSVVSNQAEIGQGVFIAKNAVVSIGSKIGEMAVINTASVIEHDCSIGKFAFISPAAALSGGVFVGDYTHVGTNATVIQNIHIGQNSMIGAGSVVVKNISDNANAYGNPCREVSIWPKESF